MPIIGLYGGDEEFAKVREKAGEGNPQILFHILEGLCQQHLKSPILIREEGEENFLKGLGFWDVVGEFLELGLLFRLTGDERFGLRAKEILLAMTELSRWVGPTRSMAGLECANLLRTVSILFDWVGELMSDEERTRLLEAAIANAVENENPPASLASLTDEKGARLLARVLDYDNPSFVWSRRPELGWHMLPTDTNNWDAVLGSALGIFALVLEKALTPKDTGGLGLALDTQDPLGFETNLRRCQRWLDIALSRTQKFLERLYDKDGCSREGVSYYGYGTMMALTFLEAYRNIKGTNLYTKPLLKSAEWAIRATSPSGKGPFGVANITDCKWEYGLRLPILLRLASEARDGEPMWFVEKCFKDFKEAVSEDASPSEKRAFLFGERGHLSFALLWYDPEIKAVRPQDDVAEFYRGKRWVILRTGWRKDDIFFVFEAGEHLGAHTHPDRCGFILEALGERFLVDSGTGPYTERDLRTSWYVHTKGHNLMLVDGQGQSRAYEVRGRIRNFWHTKEFDYFLGDAKGAYPILNKFYRHILFLRPHYFLLADEAAKKKPSIFTWLFHCVNIDGKTEIDVAGDLVIFRRPKANLFLKIVLPASPADGPQKFRYEIAPGWLDGVKDASLHIAISTEPQSEATFLAAIFPAKGAEPPEFEIIERKEQGSALRVSFGQFRDVLIFQKSKGESSYGEITTDGRLALVRERGGHIELAGLIEGRRLVIKDKEVISLKNRGSARVVGPGFD